MQINDDLLKGFQQRYSFMHPLIFKRSVEKAKTPGDLFDILENIPQVFPIVWNEDEHCWKTGKLLPKKE